MSFITVFRTFAVLLAIFAISMTGTPTKSLAKSKFVFANSSPYDTLDPHVIYLSLIHISEPTRPY